MIGIVPLAGPDFERDDGTVKAEFSVDGMPLLRRALESRPWWKSGALQPRDLIFVLHDTERSRRFAGECLTSWYAGSSTVFLSDLTAGAALSATAAVGLIHSYDEPLIVDLCDILFDCPHEPIAGLSQTASLGGLAVTFTSDNPRYSYLECDKAGRMVRSREKIVISDQASAGVYFFRSAPVYLQALSHMMCNSETLSRNGLMYVCPMLNGVVAQGLDVRCVPATDVRDIHIDVV